MPAVKCACPRCCARVPPPPGLPATLLCPACATRFTLSAAGTTLVLPPGPQTPPPARGRPAMGVLVSTPAKRTAPVPPAAPPPAPPDPGRRPETLPLLVVGLGLLSLVVVAGCVWAVVAHLRSRAGQEALAQTEAAAPEPAPVETTAPAPLPGPAAPAPRPPDQPRPGPDPLAGYVPPPAGGVAKSAPNDLPWGTSLSEAEQERVNRAIDRGVAYLKQQLASDGGGPYSGRTGAHALAGLTLLACGVPAGDLVVREAATRVRSGAAGEMQTYDLALSVLFLDRLADSKDRDLIRTLAMRLVAGQNPSGGWSYQCPLVQAKQRDELIAALRGSPSSRRPRPGDPGRVPADVMNVPVVGFWPGDKVNVQGHSDNSNTQFALLAVWTARKYNLPVDRSLAMVETRFRSSQNADGTWGYQPKTARWPDSMTCAGLLGLAVGRGILHDGKARKGPAQDPDVARALRYLGGRIGTPGKGQPRRRRGAGQVVGADAHGDLYFLWSVERVAVIYDLPRIEGKDWYGWGARLLVEHQQGDGSWQDAFAGLPDTCFALLFLKRVNVAQDLTATLRSIGSGADQRTTTGGDQRTTPPGGQRTGGDPAVRVPAK